jgi:uracil-DNA glycosylase
MQWTDLSFFTEQHDRVMRDFISNERHETTIYPADDQIYAALDMTPLESVKVVILGQDPYQNPGLAMGLAFSVPSTSKIPSSLHNIFKELYTDVGVTKESGDLSGWARQGVLLLNTVLTVRSGIARSHRNCGWERLTVEMIRTLNQSKEHLIFILWGKDAQSLGVGIDRARHCVLQAPHPSGYSVNTGFFGSKPFSQTNAYLIQHGMTPIDWSQ